MASIDGKWDCISKTPMGDQASVMELKSAGPVVTGTSTNMMGTMDITDGRIAGNTFTWQMEMKVPFPMKLTGEVSINGDSMDGTITAGFFGQSAITGTRQSRGS